MTDLYGLTPEEFTAARTAAAQEAKAAGDAGRAREISALRKPTTVAWLVNRLVRDHRDEVDELLALGDTLREATRTLDGAQLRELGRRQQELVAGLVQRARAVRPVGEDAARQIADTLQAAMADPAAAAELRAGMLVKPLERGGFPTIEGQVTRAVRPAVRTPDKKAVADAERRRDRALERIEALRADLTRAEAELAAAEEALRAARA
ncbi:hypothetical protein [Hamadaea tsunoensis]|uniref:hypothetical protein n=1 Tax=Hamadaea tsunoensis TaxID=53368 RepID=UPI0003FF5F76|nr:hypothetical protein [Hamadaea tsunoensis]